MNSSSSDAKPDPADQRERFADRLREAGVSTERFIDVHDTAKGSTNHDQRAHDDTSLVGNYGVYGGLGSDTDVVESPDPEADGPHYSGDPEDVDELWLVDVDVDDYEDAASGDVSTEGLDSLPEPSGSRVRTRTATAADTITTPSRATWRPPSSTASA